MTVSLGNCPTKGAGPRSRSRAGQPYRRLSVW
jgi:hypothetical protein